MRAFDKWRFRVKPQKIIFLDIDGVLNSMELFDKLEERDMEPFMGIDVDEDNLEQLRYIVEKTGAQIVLSSSWRHAWHEKGPMIRVGRALDQAMASYGLKIISKTKHLHKGNRSLEVKGWMRGKRIRSVVFLMIRIMIGKSTAWENTGSAQASWKAGLPESWPERQWIF